MAKARLGPLDALEQRFLFYPTSRTFFLSLMVINFSGERFRFFTIQRNCNWIEGSQYSSRGCPH